MELHTKFSTLTYLLNLVSRQILVAPTIEEDTAVAVPIAVQL
eukprot:SAG31_NODE_1314_length_8851_cov_7.233318_11_plen_42_part_00